MKGVKIKYLHTLPSMEVGFLIYVLHKMKMIK